MFKPPAGCEKEADELHQVLHGRPIAEVYSRSFYDTESRWIVFEKEIFAIIQARGRYPVLLGPGAKVVFFYRS